MTASAPASRIAGRIVDGSARSRPGRPSSTTSWPWRPATSCEGAGHLPVLPRDGDAHAAQPFFAARAEPEPLARIDALAQRLPPPFIVEVPGHGAADAGGEVLAGAPAELVLELGGVDGVALVVARPVGHEGDQLAPGPRRGPQLVEHVADGLDHLEVGALVAAADVVLLAEPARGQDGPQRAGVVLDVEPVADVVAAAVDRQRLPASALSVTSGISFSGKWNGP